MCNLLSADHVKLLRCTIDSFVSFVNINENINNRDYLSHFCYRFIYGNEKGATRERDSVELKATPLIGPTNLSTS